MRHNNGCNDIAEWIWTEKLSDKVILYGSGPIRLLYCEDQAFYECLLPDALNKKHIQKRLSIEH